VKVEKNKILLQYSRTKKNAIMEVAFSDSFVGYCHTSSSQASLFGS
jgi:hypothetical protein